MLTPFFILALLGLIFAVLSIWKPNWPLLAVAVIFLSVALLIGSK